MRASPAQVCPKVTTSFDVSKGLPKWPMGLNRGVEGEMRFAHAQRHLNTKNEN